MKTIWILTQNRSKQEKNTIFSGPQRVEIHSKFHGEVISLRHKVAPGVVASPDDALAAKAALAHVEAIVRKKPLTASALGSR